MRYVFSIHALERMKERDITREEVLDCIDDYEYMYDSRNTASGLPTKTYIGGRLVVVTEVREGFEPNVLTAHIRSQLAGDPTRPLNTGGSQ